MRVIAQPTLQESPIRSQPTWARLPYRLLALLSLAWALGTAMLLHATVSSGYGSLWSWPLWALLSAATTGSAQLVWPAQLRLVHALAAALVLAVLSLASLMLWLGPAGAYKEAQWLARAWLSVLAIYGIVTIWWWGCAHQVAMTQLRQRAATGVLLITVAFYLLGTLLTLALPSMPMQYATKSPIVLVAVFFAQAALLALLMVPGMRRHLPGVLSVMIVFLGALAAWRNGMVVLPLLAGLAPAVLALQPARRHAWALVGWVVIMTFVATSPKMEFAPALMHCLTGTVVLGVLLWLGRRLEREQCQAATETGSGAASHPHAAITPDPHPRATRQAMFVGWSVGLAVLVLGGAWQYSEHRAEELRWQATTHEASERKASQVMARLAQAMRLAQAISRLDPAILSNSTAFASHANELVRLAGPGMSAQWAPQAVLRRIAPLAGHEGALDHDLLADPQQRAAVEQTIKTRRGSWSGPFTLRQGGTGLVYRWPSFAPDGSLRGLGITLMSVPIAFGFDDAAKDRDLLLAVALGPRPEALRRVWQDPDWQDDPQAQDASVFRWGHVREQLDQTEELRVTWVPEASAQAEAVDLWLEVRVRHAELVPAMTWPAQMQALLGLTLLLGAACGGLTRLHLSRRTEQARANELGQLQAVMAHSLVSQILLEQSGQCVWANAMAAAVLKTPEPQLLAVNFFQHPVWQREGWDQAARLVLADGGQSLSFDYQGMAIAGHQLDIRLTLSRIDLQGRPMLLAQMLDLSHEHEQQQALQQQSEQAEEARAKAEVLMQAIQVQNHRLEDVLDGTQAGTWELDLGSGSAHWNERAFEMLGYRRAELEPLTTRTVEELVHPDDRENLIAELERHLQGQSPQIRHEHRIQHQDGHWIWCLLQGRIATRDAQGAPLRVSGILLDISEQKQREAELVQAREEALAATRAKSEFLATMSHEIRTPINGVLGYLQLMAREPMQPKLRDYVGKSLNTTRLLQRILNDVLDFSRIEAGKLELLLEPFDLRIMIEEVFSLMQAQLNAPTLQLHLQLDPALPRHVLGDDMRLRQVLVNLCSNAIKFTEQGAVTLQLDAQPLTAQRFRLQVQVNDTGIGIGAQQQQHLLQAFRQADGSISRRFGGSGLGLMISQRLLQLMGSPGLQLHSVQGQGSTFSFELELLLAPPPAATTGSGTASTGADGTADQPLLERRILLVEDNPTNIEVATHMLESLGAEVSIAINGQDALELLQEQGPQFDLVLMDMQMPVMDGLQATRQIKMKAQWTQLPVVALTANALEQDRQACLAAGMVAHLEKPFELDELVRVVTRHCRPARPPGGTSKAG